MNFVEQTIARLESSGDPTLIAHAKGIRARLAGQPPPQPRPFTPEYSDVLAGIRSCPDRGSVLPHTRQPGCGCAELTECRAGKGRTPGAATTQECYACVAESLVGKFSSGLTPLRVSDTRATPMNFRSVLDDKNRLGESRAQEESDLDAKKQAVHAACAKLDGTNADIEANDKLIDHILEVSGSKIDSVTGEVYFLLDGTRHVIKPGSDTEEINLGDNAPPPDVVPDPVPTPPPVDTPPPPPSNPDPEPVVTPPTESEPPPPADSAGENATTSVSGPVLGAAL